MNKLLFIPTLLQVGTIFNFFFKADGGGSTTEFAEIEDYLDEEVGETSAIIHQH